MSSRSTDSEERIMDWVWTWSGECFGYRDEDELWTYDGRHVGRFFEDDVRGPDGRYLGELRDGRLITKSSKRNQVGATFVPHPRRGGYARYANKSGFAMYAGCEDFPSPEDI